MSFIQRHRNASGNVNNLTSPISASRKPTESGIEAASAAKIANVEFESFRRWRLLSLASMHIVR